MNFRFTDNVCIPVWCLSCNGNKTKTTAKFYYKRAETRIIPIVFKGILLPGWAMLFQRLHGLLWYIWIISIQSVLTLLVRIPLRLGVPDATLSDYLCRWLAVDRWFTQGTPVSSINKIGRHDATEILLKVALSTITLLFLYILELVMPLSFYKILPLFSRWKEIYVKYTNTDHDAQWRNVINEVLLLLWLLCKSCCNIFLLLFVIRFINYMWINYSTILP